MERAQYKALRPASPKDQQHYQAARDALVAAIKTTFPDPRAVPMDAILAALAHEIGDFIRASPPERRAEFQEYVFNAIRDVVLREVN